MIVIDASAVVELLTAGAHAEFINQAIAEPNDDLSAPYLVDIEVVSAIRRMAASKRITAERCARLIDRFASLPIRRFEHVGLLDRMWELRHNFSAYDAAYIALAEQTDSVLYTCDARLANGHRARTKLFVRH